MSLTQALYSAMSGLRANQASMALVSSNVANAQTPGYIRKTTNQIAVSTGASGSGVLVAGVNRELDRYVQSQMRTELSGAAYATTRAMFLDSLQGVLGVPGSAATIESGFAQFTSAMQALATSPDSASARVIAVNAAQQLAQQLNATSQGVQTLRANADSGIGDAVRSANHAMAQIAAINAQLMKGGAWDGAAAGLLDQRDQYIEQLAELMDIKVIANDDQQVTVFTSSGVQLVGVEAATLSFQTQGTVTANTLWNRDPARRTLSSIMVDFPHGGSMDLVATQSIRSGRIAAYLELRDSALVDVQTQLDQFAAIMASAMSDMSSAGAPVSVGAQSGFDLDLAGMSNGNKLHLTYTDTVSNVQHKIAIVRVDDPSVLPLPASMAADPNERVIGIDFSGGMASVVTQLNAALGSANIIFSNPSGMVLRVLDDGAGGLSDIDAASVTTTITTLSGGVVQLPLFTDGGGVYSGAVTPSGMQMTGLAARLSVNAALVANPSLLVVTSQSPVTPAGDTSRVDHIFAQLTAKNFHYAPLAGSGSLMGFIQQAMAMQGDAAIAAGRLAEGQEVVLNTLQRKMEAVSGIDIDQEMAQLLALQNAYAANARVMSAVRDMFDVLMRSM